ncbi:MAG: sn-glycerol-3-phosphate ABC transporter ATP-binding protein UgpC [Synergistaceae bacterium]|jgi:multiple sugar transport system ATP-binding protein|nr:sn-glycerol-3-phosphate ABC transporter ATP-binding protein UgpC [Synergistaceae bacterium]
MADILLKNIKKIYPGNVVAVRDFNLEIKDKEFVILVGPSGCGKSTTLRMIAGLEGISQGELYIGGKLVNNMAPKDRDIAMVFQNYALYPHMTVYKNMAFGLTMRKMPKEKIRQKVEEAAKILDIEQLLDRKPKALSGGQRQRVALGRAMVRNPAAFLLDEPLSNLDAKLRSQMRTELSKLHKSLGATFVYVTHDQTEAMTMGDRIVVMKDGYIQQIDAPYNLYSKPRNIFVAGFIGAPQMNFINGAVVKTENGYAAEFAGCGVLLPESRCVNIGPYENKEVIFGIRPEDISVGLRRSDAVELRVDVAELMGAEMYLHCVFSGNELVVRTPFIEGCEIGSMVNVRFDPNKIHIFDKETEVAIIN